MREAFFGEGEHRPDGAPRTRRGGWPGAAVVNRGSGRPARIRARWGTGDRVGRDAATGRHVPSRSNPGHGRFRRVPRGPEAPPAARHRPKRLSRRTVAGNTPHHIVIEPSCRGDARAGLTWGTDIAFPDRFARQGAFAPTKGSSSPGGRALMETVQ